MRKEMWFLYKDLMKLRQESLDTEVDLETESLELAVFKSEKIIILKVDQHRYHHPECFL
jgi:hypothetical protein